ncbi:hypothetical protein Cantr_00579 [Candida viswanathii]|uniref:Uncharacterized protein n=1 Tax=Candida viswanathii TaxID=5486 RepID=A0A367YGA4_9ASCO|nr:hypothetical protein Cantr_00579 [Candida viswanathii]
MSTLPSQLLLDNSASTTATVTPSLTDLHVATEVRKNDNSATLASDSILTISTSLTSGIVAASESSQLSNATGTFSASSDVGTLTLSSSSGSTDSSVAAATQSANAAESSVDLRKAKFGIILSGLTILSFVCTI